jgi:hypothetical protein
LIMSQHQARVGGATPEVIIKMVAKQARDDLLNTRRGLSYSHHLLCVLYLVV